MDGLADSSLRLDKAAPARHAGADNIKREQQADALSPESSHLSPSFLWQTTRYNLDLRMPKIMGIVNITPDSFSESRSRTHTAALALKRCEELIAAGADILDLGAESSRPGAHPIDEAEELRRLLPAVKEALKLRVPISIDTYKPTVMSAVLDLGVDIINDIWGFRKRGAIEVVIQHGHCGLCVMHMHKDPTTMQKMPMHGDMTKQIHDFLLDQSQTLQEAGCTKARIVWDPGIGFGKTTVQNFALLSDQAQLLQSGYPLLVGWSRKSSLGEVTGLAVHERQIPSVAAALLAIERGARIVRVHDVHETHMAISIWQAAQSSGTVLP